MRYFIALFFVLMPFTTLAGYDLNVAEKIAFKAKEYGLNPSISVAVLICESNLKHEGVWGDQGNAYGVAQFWQGTFDKFKIMAGKPFYNRLNLDEQIDLFNWALANDLEEHWTCYKKVVGAVKIAPKLT